MTGPLWLAEGALGGGRVRRRLWRLLAATAVSVMALAPAGARPVSATVTGTIVFEGVATLSVFPCSGICPGGTFSGTATGVAVTTGGAVAVFETAPMSASFNYSETCPTTLPVMPPIGSAGTSDGLGTFDIGPQNGYSITGNFNWQRVGPVVAITTSGVVLTTPSGSTAAMETSVATAVFVPVLPIGNCAPGGAVFNQTATVVGVDVGAA